MLLPAGGCDLRQAPINCSKNGQLIGVYFLLLATVAIVKGGGGSDSGGDCCGGCGSRAASVAVLVPLVLALHAYIALIRGRRLQLSLVARRDVAACCPEYLAWAFALRHLLAG